MLNLSRQQLIDNINEIESTGLFSFVAVTVKAPLKKSRITKQATPDNLREVKVYFAGVVSLGNDYQAAVNRRLEQEGKDANFAARGTYCHTVSDNRLLFKHNDREDFYLRIYPNLAPLRRQLVRVFDADGVEITGSWAQIRDEYFDKPSENKSQGLDDAVLVRNYKLDNVKYLKRGDVHIDQITAEIAAVTSQKK